MGGGTPIKTLTHTHTRSRAQEKRTPMANSHRNIQTWNHNWTASPHPWQAGPVHRRPPLPGTLALGPLPQCLSPISQTLEGEGPQEGEWGTHCLQS